MADDGHIGFGYGKIRGRVAVKHLGDFLCLGTHELSSSEKFSQHHFANGSIGQVQDYCARFEIHVCELINGNTQCQPRQWQLACYTNIVPVYQVQMS